MNMLEYVKNVLWTSYNLFTRQTIITQLLLIAVCVGGDSIQKLAKVRHDQVLLSISDGITHALVAALSWVLYSGFRCRAGDIVMTLGCAVLGSLCIDVDHFIAARSLQLKDALSLTHRPPFHNSTLILAITLTLYLLYRYTHLTSIQTLTTMCFLSWTSHHIRDATRRGLWFWPFDHTPPLPYALYVGLIVLLPVIVRFVLPPVSYNQNINVSIV